MAKKNSAAKNDILNAVEMTAAKPVVVTTEVVNEETGTTETMTNTIAPTEVADATGTTKAKTTRVEVAGVMVDVPLGRPVNPESARQKKLREQAERASANGGTAKLGRPVVAGSANQLKKAEMEAKKADPNYVAKRGRPVVAGSARQQSLAQKDEKLMARAKQIAIEKGLINAETGEALINEGE